MGALVYLGIAASMGIIIGSIIGISVSPSIRWKCLVGKHIYTYVGQKSCMTIHKKDGVTGTMRSLYKCSCGKYKPAENEDYK